MCQSSWFWFVHFCLILSRGKLFILSVLSQSICKNLYRAQASYYSHLISHVQLLLQQLHLNVTDSGNLKGLAYSLAAIKIISWKTSVGILFDELKRNSKALSRTSTVLTESTCPHWSSGPLLSSSPHHFFPFFGGKDLQGLLMQAGRKGSTLWALLSTPDKSD